MYADLLESLRETPESFGPMMEALWQNMDKGGFSPILRQKILQFNGGLFADCTAIPLNRNQLELRDEARKVIRDFHQNLCEIRVLDPACGSGNFLYVALELMKKLEAEVIRAMRDFGDSGTVLVTIDPHQFLGIEVNPRAAAIADLVLWIGYLQWHIRALGRESFAIPDHPWVDSGDGAAVRISMTVGVPGTVEGLLCMVIDLFGLDELQVRTKFPEVYQWLTERVRPERDQNRRAVYRETWWVFGEPRRDLRAALSGLKRYLATVETSKHRMFVFLDRTILPDNKLVAIALSDSCDMAVLSARAQTTWALSVTVTGSKDKERFVTEAEAQKIRKPVPICSGV